VKDLRQWIETLEREAPQELIRIKKTVDPSKFEATAVMEKLESEGQFPAVLFENPQALKAENQGFKLLMNTFGTFSKMAVALDLPPLTPKKQLMEEILKRQDSEKEPVIVAPQESPVKENTLAEENLDLNILPIIRHVEMDGDRYLTPIVVSKNLATGRYNISWNRMMYLDPQHLAIYMSPRHLWSYFADAEQADKNLPIAVVLGHHPAFHMTGALLTPLDQDEYKVVSSFLGENIRITPSLFYGNDLYIPADAEIVIEGEIVAGQRTIEGPFGEYTGYTGPQRVSWLFEAKAMNFRSDGIIIDIFPCKTEHINAHLPIEASILRTMRGVAPNVLATSWVDSGGPLTIIIQMKKKVEGEPMRAAMAAFTASNFIKIAIVVDEDIDPTNLKEVMWAISTRVQPETDVQNLKGLQGHVLDPSLSHEIKGSGMIIDATKPLDRPFPLRGLVPKGVLRKVSLKDYLDQ
jgi:2,5-furandicarboxylate decarboxylase 1